MNVCTELLLSVGCLIPLWHSQIFFPAVSETFIGHRSECNVLVSSYEQDLKGRHISFSFVVILLVKSGKALIMCESCHNFPFLVGNAHVCLPTLLCLATVVTLFCYFSKIQEAHNTTTTLCSGGNI